MTCFFAEVLIFTAPKHEPHTIAVELPAPDIQQALALLMAWKAGLSASPHFDTAMEESISAGKRRGTSYLTLREAATHLRNEVF